MFFQYMSVFFDFEPQGPHEGASPLLVPPQGRRALKKRRECLVAVHKHWNRKSVTFEAEGDEPATGGFRVLVTRAAPLATRRPAHPQILIRVYEKGTRASQEGNTASWGLEDMSYSRSDGSRDESRLVAAHELGHAMSLPDEYLYRDHVPAFGTVNTREFLRSPGTPYSFDYNAMMGPERYVRARYFWHLVLWAHHHGLFQNNTTVTILTDSDGREENKRRFTTALTPRDQNRVQFPVASTANGGEPVGDGGRGFCDLFVYVTGQDEFTAGILSPHESYDGFITVRVKMAWRFDYTSNFDRMKELLSDAYKLINTTFNYDRKLVVNGTFDGAEARLRVLFCPRFVCQTLPSGLGSRDYLDNSLDRSWQGRADVLSNPAAWDRLIDESVDVYGVHAQVTVTKEDLAPGVVAAVPPGRRDARVATIRTRRLRQLFDDDVLLCFAQLVGLANDNLNSAEDFRALFDPFTVRRLPTDPPPRLVITAPLEFAK